MKTIKYLIFTIALILSYNTHSQTRKTSTAETYYKSAVSSFETGDLDDAIVNINKSISIEPNNSNAYYTKGVIYQKKLNYDVALTCYKKALQLNPNNFEAMLKCGIVYGKKNDMINFCKYMKMACDNGDSNGCSGYSKFCK